MLFFLGVSQAHSVLPLLLHGLELLSSRPLDLSDLQPVVYTELILNIVTHFCYISLDFCWLLICFHYWILDWVWDQVCASHAQKGIMGNMFFVYCQYLRYGTLWIFCLAVRISLTNYPWIPWSIEFLHFHHWVAEQRKSSSHSIGWDHLSILNFLWVFTLAPGQKCVMSCQLSKQRG